MAVATSPTGPSVIDAREPMNGCLQWTLRRLLLLVVSLLAVTVVADESQTGPSVNYETTIEPLLQRACVSCHGSEQAESGLRLDQRQSALTGGDFYGPSIVPGKPNESPLLDFVANPDAELQMPPDGPPLSAEEIEHLRAWILQGASWPDAGNAAIETPDDHWAFEPLRRPPVPARPQVIGRSIESNLPARDFDSARWAEDPIDRFVLARLLESGLTPSRPAPPHEWLRRVCLDLTGLPPTPEMIDSFLIDPSPTARHRVVERLLASPAYGERWAQHWFDVVRYADTHGFEVNTERPHAWQYRDWVIEALNDDLPYDAFIRQQIAGDALEADRATGFLVTASVLLPGQIGKDEASMRLARQDAIDEIVVNISQSFLGLSLGCARCHNHKFDPFSQRDYYAMQAFVAGVEYEDRPVDDGGARDTRRAIEDWKAQQAKLQRQMEDFAPIAQVQSDEPSRPAINAQRNLDRFAPRLTTAVRFTVRTTNLLEPCLDELEVFDLRGTNVALAAAGAKATASGSTVAKDRHELRLVNDGQYGNSSSWMSDQKGGGWVVIEWPEPREIDRVVWGRDRQGQYDDRLAIDYLIEVRDSDGDWTAVADASDRRKKEQAASVADADSVPPGLQRLEAQHQRLAARIERAESTLVAFAGRFRSPDPIRLLRRGDPEQPLAPVPPAVPAQLGILALEEDAAEQQRRLALAGWIADPENPLTSRVMVNRIWQGHFGVGLVETANDFGRNGTPPSHPELLNWLASELIASGWSMKEMHRRIVLSATYAQSGVPSALGQAVDADNRLLWRYPARRLGGEAIRDAVLQTSGQLVHGGSGPGFDLFNQRGGLSGFQPVEEFPAEGFRRMVYAHRVRRERGPVFGAFDCPDNGQSTPRRRESTTPIQALNLLNSPFMLQQSEGVAERAIAIAGVDEEEQIQAAYRLTLGRPATPHEVARGLPIVQQHGLVSLTRALLNSNEFLLIP